MIRRPPRSTLDRSSAASDVYKRQVDCKYDVFPLEKIEDFVELCNDKKNLIGLNVTIPYKEKIIPVSYTHLRAHETVLDLVCRLLLEKKKKEKKQ